MDYNIKYSKKDFYWGLKPHKLVINSIKYLFPNSKVLDLGCGEGKDSLFLAKKGLEVTSVDVSEVGIKKLKNIIKKEKLSIKTYILDLKSFLDSCYNFKAIFCINSLQFINQKNIISTINKIKDKTESKGFNIISSFVAKNQKQKNNILAKGKYFFTKGELKEIYKDWRIIFYEEKLGNWETHGEPRHRHFIVKLIAQKY